jgi:hypothetical protein
MSTTILDKRKRLSKRRDSWDKAIADAQELIREAEAEIARLKQSIVLFTDLKRRGAKLPSPTRRSRRAKQSEVKP